MSRNAKNIVKTIRGKIIDMEKLRNLNGSVRAIGNANLNARGDRLDSGGRVIRKREDIVNEYYKNQNEGIRYVSLSSMDMENTLPQNNKPEVEFKTVQQINDSLDKPDNVAKRKRKLIDEE